MSAAQDNKTPQEGCADKVFQSHHQHLIFTRTPISTDYDMHVFVQIQGTKSRSFLNLPI